MRIHSGTVPQLGCKREGLLRRTFGPFLSDEQQPARMSKMSSGNMEQTKLRNRDTLRGRFACQMSRMYEGRFLCMET